MYKIKQLPEDFIVEEISELEIGNGPYAYYTLKKTNYNTIDALQALSEKLKAPLKNFGFAGNKDRNAVTEQKISIFRGSKNFENAQLKDIGLEYLGNGKEQISLGNLQGNKFSITIRNLQHEEAEKIKSLQNKTIKVPNLYGPQRFSKNNHLVGKAIIKKDFRKAVGLLLENNGLIEEKIKIFLQENKENPIAALRLVPLKTRKLFVHSYQSFLFNKIADEYLKNRTNEPENAQIPLIGFDFEPDAIKDKELKSIVKKAIEEEKITSRDFVVRAMPELTSAGGFRSLFFEISDFGVDEIAEDELNKGMQKAKVKFSLPKGCYATTALEFIFRQP